MLINSNHHKIRIIGQTTVARDLLEFLRSETGLPAVDMVSFEMAISDARPQDYQYVVGVLRNSLLRRQVIAWIMQHSLHAVGYQHPQSWVSSTARLGRGTIIYPMASVLDSDIGGFCVVTSHSHVGHAANLGHNVLMLPGTAVLGSSMIANGTVLQTGATVIDNVSVTAENVNILPRSLVTKDILLPGTYGGSPCKKINSKSVLEAEYFCVTTEHNSTHDRAV